MTVFLFLLLLFFFFLLLLFFFFGMVPWQIFSCSENKLKKTGRLNKERKDKRSKKEITWLVFFRGFQNGLVLYSLVLQPNENAQSRNRKYALKDLSALITKRWVRRDSWLFNYCASPCQCFLTLHFIQLLTCALSRWPRLKIHAVLYDICLGQQMRDI